MPAALVVYESMFGDAQEVARSIARGLEALGEVRCVEAAEAPTSVPEDVVILVAGSPNHAFGLPRGNTREEAAKKTDRPLVSEGPGLREWLAALQPPPSPVAAATFDTRMSGPKVVTKMDHAAGTAAKRLARIGFRLVSDSEAFYVEDVKGPLVDGETERAEAWGARLATIATG